MGLDAAAVPISIILPFAVGIAVKNLPFVGQDVIRLDRELKFAQPVQSKPQVSPGVDRPKNAATLEFGKKGKKRGGNRGRRKVVDQGAVKIGAQQADH